MCWWYLKLSPNADWNHTPDLVHVAESGISKMALVRKTAMQGAYVEELERKTVMLRHFDEAIVD